jgi:hypothetical protein
MPELERSYSLRWLGAFDRLRSWISTKPRLLKLSEAIVLGAILFAPSVWMLHAIPPLWRDSDAYIQVTFPPGLLTIVHFGPVYCFAARIPLYIGYAIESLRAGSPLPTLGFFIHPTLNDSGVFLLLLSQHVALVCSAFYLIVLTSRLFWVRLALSVLWAANPLFYTFAHCVGSETLSMILALVAGAVGLRIVQARRNVGWKQWLLFGILLWLSILTRHINAVLAAVMPLTFLFLSAYRSISSAFSRSPLLFRWRRLLGRWELREATVAIAIGVGSIALANLSVRGLCRVAHMPYYSTIGMSVMSRLDFLALLPPEKRNQLLDEIARNTSSVQVKQVIPVLRESFSKMVVILDTNAAQRYFSEKHAEKVLALYREAFPQGTLKAEEGKPARELFFIEQIASQNFHFLDILLPNAAMPSPRDPAQHFERSRVVALNRTAEAFLFPPRRAYIDAVAEDFRRSQTVTIPNVVNYLFLTTTLRSLYLVGKIDNALLPTLGNTSLNQIIAILEKHGYFHLWKSVNHAAFLCFWAATLALLAVLARMRKQSVAAAASYAVTLTLVGLLMMLASCVLAAFLPRFTLPMWELTIVSATVLLGRTLELATTAKSQNFCP